MRRVAVPGDDDERAKTSRRRVPRETGESGEDSSEPSVGERSASSVGNERRRAEVTLERTVRLRREVA